jgi:hypothetical protein
VQYRQKLHSSGTRSKLYRLRLWKGLRLFPQDINILDRSLTGLLVHAVQVVHVHTEEGGRVSYKPYQQFSQEFFSALKAFPGLRTVEKASIDEAYIELSPTAAGAPTLQQGWLVARELKAAVMQSLGLVCSVGVARNKVLAKLASQRSKPDGVLVVDSAQGEQTLLDASPGGHRGQSGPLEPARTVGVLTRDNVSTEGS